MNFFNKTLDTYFYLIYYTSDIVKSVFGRSIITTLDPRITVVDRRDDIDVVKVRMESLL